MSEMRESYMAYEKVLYMYYQFHNSLDMNHTKTDQRNKTVKAY